MVFSPGAKSGSIGHFRMHGEKLGFELFQKSFSFLVNDGRVGRGLNRLDLGNGWSDGG